MGKKLSKYSQEEIITVYNLLTNSRAEFNLTANDVAVLAGFAKATYYKCTSLLTNDEDTLMRAAIACGLRYRDFLLFCDAAHIYMSEKSPRCLIIMRYLKTTAREEYDVFRLDDLLIQAGFAQLT